MQNMEESFEVDGVNSLLLMLNSPFRTPSVSSSSFDRSDSTYTSSSSDDFEGFTPNEITISHEYTLESKIRQIILGHLRKECRTSSDKSKDRIQEKYLRINRIHNSTGYIYILKTLIQSTGRKPTYQPLGDSFTNLPDHTLCLMDLEPPDEFVDGKTTFIEIPNTCQVRPCFACGGSGREICRKCPENFIVCTTCYGRTVIRCNTCKSNKNLLHFISQVYKWDTKEAKFVYSPTQLISREELLKVTGYPVLEESNAILSPLSEGKVNCEEVINFSQDAFKSISNLPENVSVVKQHQSVIGIEILLVEISYQGNSGTYAIFGEEKIVKTVIDVASRWTSNFRMTLL